MTNPEKTNENPLEDDRSLDLDFDRPISKEIIEKPNEKKEAKEKIYPIKQICASCKTVINESVGMSNVEGEISHGSCVECTEKQKREMREKYKNRNKKETE
jgi:hypothetical protein